MADSANAGMMREVVVAQPVVPPWKEIVVNTGASVSTLQDIKVPDSCGGYTYRDSGQPGSPVRNRFIYWRTSGDVLELEESSLDMVLQGGRVRYRLQDTPIVGGVSVSETHGHVVVLVATVASVHRLVFPHPSQKHQRDTSFAIADHIATSIFYDASLSTAIDPKNMHMLNPGGSITAHLISATSYVSPESEAIFALGTTGGSVILLKMPPLGITGVVIQHELSHSSVMQKLWSGLVPGMIRGHQQSTDAAVSLEMQPFRGEAFVFALCRDLRLRVWTTKTRDCVLAANLLEMLPDGSQTVPATGGHVIKRVQSSKLASLMFCVYLSFPDRSQFLLLEPTVKGGRFVVQQHAVLTQPAEDLIDFCVTADHLVTLWTGSTGETIARAALLSEANPTGEWRELLLEPPDVSEPLIPQNRDPRDFFLERIFHPREFCHQDIMRALGVYRRSHDTTVPSETLLMTCNLREEVITAVENEIRNCVSDYEMPEEAYYQLQVDQWGRFYSCCCQYREVGAKLQGVFADSVTGLVCLIRKAAISYLRPCDLLERLYLCGEEKLTPAYLDEINFAAEGVSPDAVCEDVYKICNITRLIQEEMSEELATQFILELEMLESPVALAEGLVETVFFEVNDLNTENGAEVRRHLQEVRNLVPSLDLLQRLLDVQEVQDNQAAMDDSGAEDVRQLNYNRLFTSQEASAVVARTFEQMCFTRLSFLRDLIILQVLTLRLGEKGVLTPNVCASVEQELLPNYSNLMRSYVVLYWASQTLTANSPTSSLDSNMRRLATLELNDSKGFPSQRQAAVSISVVESFIQGVGGARARQQVAMTAGVDAMASWSHDLLTFVHSLASLIWPLSDETIFPEFLAGSCQYLALQNYVRLLRSWCTWNDAAAMFFLGLAYLHFDEPQKARRCFVSASEGITTETFLAQKLLQKAEGTHRQLTILYYLKVIKQFEEFGMADMVISLANEAICLADPEDPNLATLQSKVFKYQLELGHNLEAYTAMMANPDPSRRKDCLRQLVVGLCERGELQALVEFPYNNMEEEIETVLESRARSVDLATHNYYNLLYSFYVYRNNMRKAASVMYEHGLRLGREMPGLKGLQRQAQCYLAAMNVLRLVKPEYAWIVKPELQTGEETQRRRRAGSESPSKHDVEGFEKTGSQGKKKVEIVELSQLEKDYLLLDARLRLIRKNPEPTLMSGPTPGADEMVGILVNAGLYDLAIIVCRAFSLPLHTVFTSLALRCVNLARASSYFMVGDNSDTSDAWEWLRENDIRSSAASKDGSAADHAWKLLQRYLESFEESDARYHRCVAEKLLSQGFPLPAWLVNSYKVWGAPQLLRVFLDYDLLQPAALLFIEYLEALMGVLTGQDAPVFGLKGILQHSPMSVWVPYTCVDQLLGALKRHQDEHTNNQLQCQLLEKMAAYHRKVEELSGAA